MRKQKTQQKNKKKLKHWKTSFKFRCRGWVLIYFLKERLCRLTFSDVRSICWTFLERALDRVRKSSAMNLLVHWWLINHRIDLWHRPVSCWVGMGGEWIGGHSSRVQHSSCLPTQPPAARKLKWCHGQRRRQRQRCRLDPSLSVPPLPGLQYYTCNCKHAMAWHFGSYLSCLPACLPVDMPFTTPLNPHSIFFILKYLNF